MTEKFEPITDKTFEKMLEEKIDEANRSELLQIKGLYEILSEHFNNEILEEYEEQFNGMLDENECLEQFLSIYETETVQELREKINDDIMLREDYNNFTDSLCKSGEITDYLYENMDNPF